MKLSDIYPLNEIIFNGAADVHWQAYENKYEGVFKFNGDTYTIRLSNYSSDRNLYGPLAGAKIYDVQFGDGDPSSPSMKATNKGFPYDVLGIVQNETIAKFREIGLPDVISITVSDDPLDNTVKQANRRRTIYGNMAKTIKNQLGYAELHPNIAGKMSTFTLISNVELSPDDIKYISRAIQNFKVR